MNKRPRKLMPKEKEMLRSLENDLQKEQKLLQQKTEAAQSVMDHRVNEVTKTATERVRVAAERFKVAKTKLEGKKQAAIAKVEKEYERELSLLHSEKTGVCSAAET